MNILYTRTLHTNRRCFFSHLRSIQTTVCGIQPQTSIVVTCKYAILYNSSQLQLAYDLKANLNASFLLGSTFVCALNNTRTKLNDWMAENGELCKKRAGGSNLSACPMSCSWFGCILPKKQHKQEMIQDARLFGVLCPFLHFTSKYNYVATYATVWNLEWVENFKSCILNLLFQFFFHPYIHINFEIFVFLFSCKLRVELQIFECVHMMLIEHCHPS